MTTKLDPSTTQGPRRAELERTVAMRLAATEYDRVVTLLERLSPTDWTAATDCPGWDVRAMVGHLLGMAQMTASVVELGRQQLGSKRRFKRDGGLLIDALTALQVDKNAALTTDELVDAMRRTGPKAARTRRRAPGPVRRMTMPDDQDVAGGQEKWTFGYLTDVILTRDPFLHRIDIGVATGTWVDATAEHEGTLVDDVVHEWAGRHGQDYALELTGAAGGQWSRGTGGEPISMDAFEFCRVLGGRAPGVGLLTTQVPF